MFHGQEPFFKRVLGRLSHHDGRRRQGDGGFIIGNVIALSVFKIGHFFLLALAYKLPARNVNVNSKRRSS
jgi:hypothetical protein